VLHMKPGWFPLGSAQSRAAARSLLAARKRSEADKPGNLSWLAETIRAGRMRAAGEESPAPFPVGESGRDGYGERRTDCLSDRISRARERVRRAQDTETMPSGRLPENRR
jgi:hypothetical protein